MVVSIYPAETISPTRRPLLGTAFRLGRSRQSFTLPFGVRMRIRVLATGTRPHPRTNAHSESEPSKRAIETEARSTILRRRDGMGMRSTGGGRERLRESRVTISRACARSSCGSQRLVLLEPDLLHPPIFLLTAAILIINNIIIQKSIVVLLLLLLWSGSSGPLAIPISITCPPSKPSSETSTIPHADNDNIIRGE